MGVRGLYLFTLRCCCELSQLNICLTAGTISYYRWTQAGGWTSSFASLPSLQTSTNANLWIGARGLQLTQGPFKGSISQFRVWKAALSQVQFLFSSRPHRFQAQIEAEAMSSTPIVTANLVAAYDMSTNSGQLASSTGASYNAQLIGGAVSVTG